MSGSGSNSKGGGVEGCIFGDGNNGGCVIEGGKDNTNNSGYSVVNYNCASCDAVFMSGGSSQHWQMHN